MARIEPEFPTEKLESLIKGYFEPQLRRLDIAQEQIEKQNLEQLQNSLIIVDGAINNPDSFGKLGIIFGAVSGSFEAIIARSDSAHNIEVGVLPLLLERKKLILDRINLLKGEQKIENLRDLIDKVPEISIRNGLLQEIDSLNAEAQKFSKQTEEIEEAQKREQIRIKAEINELNIKTELFERRSKVWLSFLERESVATIIGGILLLVFALAYVFAMFLHFTPLDIMNNSFLVILGYFFGQTVARASLGSKGEQKAEGTL